ncbi:MAG: hypothetical protein MJZ34_05170 [Paludibacteraceae bacterium]|nr:hypothetical protein [Paludibacteraceae bacterium]
MTTFDEYIKVQEEKASNTTIMTKEINPELWCGRKEMGQLFLYRNNRKLNLDKLKSQMHSIYVYNHLENYGFDKLEAADLAKYNTVKELLKPVFYNDYYLLNGELDIPKIANMLYNSEQFLKNWHPDDMGKIDQYGLKTLYK